MFLEVEDLGSFMLPPVRTLPCRVSNLDRLVSDVVLVKLRLPPTAEFSFIPGQYVDLIGPNGIRRSYSIANASFAEKTIELHIREVSGGAMSDYWFNQANPNDLLRLNGPHGTFFLRETKDVDLFFLATGTGIAPVKVMLESMADLTSEQSPNSVTVLWGVRNSQDHYLNVAGMPGPHVFIPGSSRP